MTMVPMLPASWLYGVRVIELSSVDKDSGADCLGIHLSSTLVGNHAGRKRVDM